MKEKIMTLCIIGVILILVSIPINFSIDSFNGNVISSNTTSLYTKYMGNFWRVDIIGGKTYFGNWGIDREPPVDDISLEETYYFPFSIPTYFYIIGNKIVSVFE